MNSWIFIPRIKWKHFILNTLYIFLTTGKLIPSKKDVNDTFSLPTRHGPVPSLAYLRSFYRTTYFFDAIGDNVSITEDLKLNFPTTFRQILSIAYYLIMEDRNPMSRFTKWAFINSHSFDKDVPSQRIIELLC